MSDYPDDIHELLADVGSFLGYQKRLGHPGLPVDLLIKRRAELRRASESIALAPTKGSAVDKGGTDSSVQTGKGSGDDAGVNDSPASDKQQVAMNDMLSGKRPTLDEIQTEIGNCERCKLCKARKTIVFGEGDPEADIMFIGEGPGADEDEQGRPFVGRAGKELTRWIELGMGLERAQVYIGNIVKCRPPNNRDPEKDEVAACIGFIKKQIQSVNPKVIVLLGRVPMGHILGERTGITKVHGDWYDYEGIPTMPVFHPSYVLRPPQNEKRKQVWGDIKKILTRLDMPIPVKKTKE